MSNRTWLCLLLVGGVLVFCRTAMSQTPPISSEHLGAKQSHRELPGQLDTKDAAQMMAERLRELHELHELQDELRDLLRDPDFLDEIKKNFTDEQRQQLQEKILKGEGLSGDSNWNDLWGKLDKRHIDILRRWAEHSRTKPMPPPNGPPGTNGRASSSPPSLSSSSALEREGTSLQPMSPPERSFWERMRAESEEWLSRHVDDLSDDTVAALAKMAATEEDAPLAEFLRTLKQADFPSGDLTESARGLSRYLPDLEDFLHEQSGSWDEARSLFREISLPSLPGLGNDPLASSLPSTSPTEDRWGAASLTLLTLGLFVLLMWKMGVGSRPWKNQGDDNAWRLGAWPVPPGAVASRHDLVRAFEYLALLCLGHSASTRNHRELAGRLAEQNGDDPARRQAVELLVYLYEQARYAPADESLSPAELSDARHALRYLAGVTIA